MQITNVLKNIYNIIVSKYWKNSHHNKKIRPWEGLTPSTSPFVYASGGDVNTNWRVLNTLKIKYLNYYSEFRRKKQAQ